MAALSILALGEKLILTQTKKTSDFIYQQFVADYIGVGATGYTASAALSSSFSAEQYKNLTNQDAAKLFFSTCDQLLGLEYQGMTIEKWKSIHSNYLDNLVWISDQLWTRVEAAATYSGDWTEQPSISIGLLISTLVTAAISTCLQIGCCFRLQREIVKRANDVDRLEKAMMLVYDCVPKQYSLLARAGQVSVARRCNDTCILMMDVVNIAILMTEFEPEEFLNVISGFYDMFELVVSKYNCFKVEVAGDLIVMGAGVGETHGIDHCAEMVYMALEMQDNMEAVVAINERKDTEVPIQLQIGIHIGQCVTQMLNIILPRNAILGEVMKHAALIHSCGLPLKVHVSDEIKTRLENYGELDFIKRGYIQDGRISILTFWVSWATDSGDVDGYSGASSISSDNVKRRIRVG